MAEKTADLVCKQLADALQDTHRTVAGNWIAPGLTRSGA
jgi:hypothetical protein